MTTILDLEEIMAEGEAMVKEWEAEFQIDWNRPLIEATMVRELLTLPPDVVKRFAASNPSEFAAMKKQIDRMKELLGPIPTMEEPNP